MSDDNNHRTLIEQSLTSDFTALGHLIAKRRREMNLSVAELAKIAEISVADIEALEAGTWDVDLLLVLEIAQVMRQNLGALSIPPS